MGEYIGIDGEHTKIGTTESLFYCRYSDLVDAIATGRATEEPGNQPPAEYLGGRFRFRFPFPQEDGTMIGAYTPHNRALAVRAPAELVRDFDHGRATAQLAAWDGSHQVSVFSACPQSPESDGEHSGVMPVLEIVQQRPLDGELWLVCQCPYCGALRRLTLEEVDALRATALSPYLSPDAADMRAYLTEVFARALAGYHEPAATMEPKTT